MLKFFRKIRKKLVSKGKTGTYLKYALGEIVLVVIGILIALQINNWNGERKERKLESRFIELLTLDLRSDTQSLKELIEISDATVFSKNLVLDYQDGKIARPDSLGKHFLGAVFHGIPSFVPNHGALEDIQNAGGLSLIKDQDLCNQILKLYNTYDLFEKNVGANYLKNRSISRELVFQRANGNLFNRDLNANKAVIDSLILDSEIRDRLISNWTLTYNRTLKDVLHTNLETIEVCEAYIRRVNE